MSLQELANISISQIPKTRELYTLDEPIEIASPLMRVAFVERDRYGQMFIKLEFTDVGQNQSMRKFYTIIHTLERIFYKKLCYMLNLKPENCTLASQIYKNPKKQYDPILTVKIPKKKGKNYIDATIVNSTKRTFYDVRQHDFVSVKIFAKCLWTNMRKFTMKWNINELEFKDPDTDDEAEVEPNTETATRQHINNSNSNRNGNNSEDNNNDIGYGDNNRQQHHHDGRQHNNHVSDSSESKYNHREYYKKQEPQRGGGYVGFSQGNYRNTSKHY